MDISCAQHYVCLSVSVRAGNVEQMMHTLPIELTRAVKTSSRPVQQVLCPGIIIMLCVCCLCSAMTELIPNKL